MGNPFRAPKLDSGLAAMQAETAAREAEAKRKAEEEAEKERLRMEEERRAMSMGLRGRRGFLSEAGETGFPATLGGV